MKWQFWEASTQFRGRYLSSNMTSLGPWNYHMILVLWLWSCRDNLLLLIIDLFNCLSTPWFFFSFWTWTMLTVLKKLLWIRLSVVWEALIICTQRLQQKEVFNLHPQRKIRSILFTSLFLRCQTFCTYVFNISFVQTCRIRSQPPCLQLLPIWRIQIQVWCGHIQGSQEEQIQKGRDYYNAGPVFAEHQMINFSYSDSFILRFSLYF